MRAVSAEERERWANPVKALLAAHDAELGRILKSMQERGVRMLHLPIEAADEFAAVQALRDLCGPNGQIEPTKPAKGK
jgi:hypothetical protein